MPRLAIVTALVVLAGCESTDLNQALEATVMPEVGMPLEGLAAGYFSPTPLGDTGPRLEVDVAELGTLSLSGGSLPPDTAVFMLPRHRVDVVEDEVVFDPPPVSEATDLIPVVWFDTDGDERLDLAPDASRELAVVLSRADGDERAYLVSYRNIPELELVEARTETPSGREARLTAEDASGWQAVLVASTP